ncbi:hypothetical protein BJX99DRAFT_249156 [Aspergillus californicus]
MFLDGFKGALAATNVAAQIWAASTEGYSGVSGQDSVIRAVFTVSDSTSGLLLFLGLLHFVEVLKDGSFLKIHRWDLLHPPSNANIVNSFELPLRSRWRQIDKPSRSARMEWRSKTETDYTILRITPNTSLLIVPYMRAQVPPSVSRAPLANIPTKEISITSLMLIQAAARSMAAWFAFISWSFVAFCTQTCLICFCASAWWQRLILIPALLGRLMITWFQLSSVLTYSCQYKGVCTWASPWLHRFAENDWNEKQQEAFSGFIWTHLKWDFFAKALFWTAGRLWSPLMSSIVPSGYPGSTMFANFGSPQERDCVNGGELLVTISEKTPVTDHSIFRICFRNVPEQLKFYMERPLRPDDQHRRIMGWPLVLPVFCTILEPIILALGDTIPAGQTCYLIEQVVLAVMRYYDFGRISINTVLEDDIFPTADMYIEAV